MSFRINRLRRWFAGGAIAAILLVAAMYFYARHRVQNALQQVPEKIGLDIQQSATGFTISKSEQGRTLFKIQASKAVQFKQGGHAELHQVAITLYGRDSSRFDQIYGDDFEYDQGSGNVTAKGEVQIDLEANPQGILSPDQAAPRELKNPIHLRTSGLVFNQKTGNAYTREKVEFSFPQASGSALGVTYDAKSRQLTLASDVRVSLQGRDRTEVSSSRAVITRDPRWVVLTQPRVRDGSRQFEGDQATFFLRNDNTLDSAVVRGNVLVKDTGPRLAEIRSQELNLKMSEQGANLDNATFVGSVQANFLGKQNFAGSSGRLVFSFMGKNLLAKVRAEDGVQIAQRSDPSALPSNAQDFDLKSQAVDFFFRDGRFLDRAAAAPSPEITVAPQDGSRRGQTKIIAAKFEAHFLPSGQLTSIHGSPEARIVSQNPGQADRISTSDSLDVSFRAGKGLDTIQQDGNVAYQDGERKAFGDRARYTAADQILELIGNPRIVDGAMMTTAVAMRMNRATGEAFAQGEVKSTYSDLKAQPGGALLASSSPIHVSAQSMVIHGTPPIALYKGEARLWQDANLVEAPSIEFDRDRRAITARGSTKVPVSTTLVQSDKNGKTTPLALTAMNLTYVDGDRKAQFAGNVVARGSDLTITADRMEAFLQSRGLVQTSPSEPGKLDRIVASGQVAITQPNRRATGEQLVYAVPEETFVLSGGIPSIFDAEHGKITGVSLTFFRRDDRVLVEGNDSSPTVTQTRVAR